MDKFYKNFLIARLILWGLTAVFIALKFVLPIFIYFAVITATIAFVLLGVAQIFKYKDLKKRIEEGYDVYLANYYRDGFITKEQFANRAPELYPEYKRLYKGEKAVKIFTFLVVFGLALVLVVWLLKAWF